MKTRINKKYKRKSKYSKKSKFVKSKCKTKMKGGWPFGKSKPNPTPNFGSSSTNLDKITKIATTQGLKHPIDSGISLHVANKLAEQKNDIDRIKILLNNPKVIIFALKPGIKFYIPGSDKQIKTARHELYAIIRLLIDLLNSIWTQVLKGKLSGIAINNIDNNIIDKLMNLPPEVILAMMRMDTATIQNNFGINIDNIASQTSTNVKLSTYRIEINNFIQKNTNINLVYIIGKIKELIKTFLPPTTGFGNIQSMPQQAMPPQAMPQQAMPQQGMPQQAMLQQAMPQQAMPQQSMPQQAMPQQAMPQQAQQQKPSPAFNPFTPSGGNYNNKKTKFKKSKKSKKQIINKLTSL